VPPKIQDSPPPCLFGRFFSWQRFPQTPSPRLQWIELRYPPPLSGSPFPKLILDLSSFPRISLHYLPILRYFCLSLIYCSWCFLGHVVFLHRLQGPPSTFGIFHCNCDPAVLSSFDIVTCLSKVLFLHQMAMSFFLVWICRWAPFFFCVPPNLHHTPPLLSFVSHQCNPVWSFRRVPPLPSFFLPSSICHVGVSSFDISLYWYFLLFLFLLGPYHSHADTRTNFTHPYWFRTPPHPIRLFVFFKFSYCYAFFS